MTAPEAESDPRNYVLFPMEGLVEDNEDDHAPEEVTNYIYHFLTIKNL